MIAQFPTSLFDEERILKLTVVGLIVTADPTGRTDIAEGEPLPTAFVYVIVNDRLWSAGFEVKTEVVNYMPADLTKNEPYEVLTGGMIVALVAVRFVLITLFWYTRLLESISPSM